MKKGENFLTWKAELAGIDRVKSRCEIVLNILTLKAEQARTDRVKSKNKKRVKTFSPEKAEWAGTGGKK
jgi:hypothetical protein